MIEKVLSICFGSVTAFVTSLMTEKAIEVIVLSFIGGALGWFGGKFARWIDKKCGCLFTKKTQTKKSE